LAAAADVPAGAAVARIAREVALAPVGRDPVAVGPARGAGVGARSRLAGGHHVRKRTAITPAGAAVGGVARQDGADAAAAGGGAADHVEAIGAAQHADARARLADLHAVIPLRFQGVAVAVLPAGIAFAATPSIAVLSPGGSHPQRGQQ